MAHLTHIRSRKTVGFATLAALCLACALAFAGCSGQAAQPAPTVQKDPVEPAASSDHSSEPLKVAVQYNALSIPTVYAAENGYFSDEGLQVELSTFVNGAEENEAMEKEGYDIASDGLASIYLLATGRYSWIGESDSATSTVAIYMKEGSAPTLVEGELPDNPTIKGSADTLKGLIVVGPAGTMEEWAAVSYFAQFGLEAGVDYEYIEKDRGDAAKSVIDGNADVFIATDADFGRVMEENGFVTVASGVEATRVPFNNGYLVKNTVLNNRPDDLVAFLKAVYRAAETLVDNPDEWAEFAHEFYRMNGKPATIEDVRQEIEVRKLLVPADFESPTYRLGEGVLDIGFFHTEIGALDETQLKNTAASINPDILNEALGLSVKAATLEDSELSASLAGM